MDAGDLELIGRRIDERFGAAPDVTAFEGRLATIESDVSAIRQAIADMQVAQAIATTIVTEAAADVVESAAAVEESATIVEENAENAIDALIESETLMDETNGELSSDETPPMIPATPEEDTGGSKRWFEKPLFGRS